MFLCLDVQKEDSGYFACEMPRDETLAYTRLDVYRKYRAVYVAMVTIVNCYGYPHILHHISTFGRHNEK